MVGGAEMTVGNEPDAVGEIDVSILDGVLECRAHGVISRATQRATYRAIDEALKQVPGPVALLWDSLRVEGFEPGLPMALTRFLISRVEHFSRAALVSRNPTIVAVARAVRVLLPPIPYTVFADRDDAIEFLRASR